MAQLCSAVSKKSMENQLNIILQKGFLFKCTELAMSLLRLLQARFATEKIRERLRELYA